MQFFVCLVFFFGKHQCAKFSPKYVDLFENQRGGTSDDRSVRVELTDKVILYGEAPLSSGCKTAKRTFNHPVKSHPSGYDIGRLT